MFESMSRVIRVSEGTSERTDVCSSRTKCFSRCRGLSGSRRETLRGLMYDVVELSVSVDVEGDQGLGGNLCED